MKKIGEKKNSVRIFVGLIVGCVVCLIIFGVIEHRKTTSRKLWNEMQAAWLDEYKVKIPWDGKTGYYGTYQGDVVVWFEQGVLAVASERKVAGEMFWWPSSFVIQVYHDGEFLLLEKAYEEGWLTQKDIRTIAKRHTKQVNSHFPWAKNEEKNGLSLGV
jgi:hypothetical protein